MTARTFGNLPVCAVAVLFLATSCATTGINKGQLNLVSTQEEIQLGKNIAAEIDKEQPILNDPELSRYVSEIGKKLAAQTERQDIPYSFKIIDNDEEINAFAVPGGPIYVYTGLIRFAENEAELASVLGHEVAHIDARHSTEQITKSYGIALLSQIVLGDNPAFAATLAADIVGSLGMLKFSRDDEIEADRLGVQYMYRADYNPHAMMSFQQKLGGLQSESPNQVLNLLSTHPMSQARVEAIGREIATLPPGRPVQYHTERYNRIVGGTTRQGSAPSTGESNGRFWR